MHKVENKGKYQMSSKKEVHSCVLVHISVKWTRSHLKNDVDVRALTKGSDWGMLNWKRSNKLRMMPWYHYMCLFIHPHLTMVTSGGGNMRFFSLPHWTMPHCLTSVLQWTCTQWPSSTTSLPQCMEKMHCWVNILCGERSNCLRNWSLDGEDDGGPGNDKERNSDELAHLLVFPPVP